VSPSAAPGLRRLAAALCAAGALACAGGPPPPPDTFHRLVVPAATSDVALPGAVEVDRFRASAVLLGRPLAVADAGGRRLRHAAYDFWVDAPPVLLQRALVERLRAGALAPEVVTPEQRRAVPWAVSGRVERFERVAGRGGAVALELRLQRRGEPAPRVHGVYRAERAARSDDAAGAVEALGLATGDAFAAFWADVEAALAAPPAADGA